MDDTQLLYDFARTGSQAAFAELVRRHINLVYAAARRQVAGDSHLADDVTQAVFLILAKKAGRVRNGAVLPAWLISTTRYAASNARSLESRRRRHEHKAAAMATLAHQDADPAVLDDTLAPSLDEALERLGQTDRSAVAMRYLQGMSIREVGAALGVSEEAAQKRVNRAVEKLRQFFARRGVTIESARLASGLARQAAHVAPAMLAPAIIRHALAGSAAASTSAGLIAKGTAKAIAWAHAKFVGAVAAGIIVAAGSTTVAVKVLAPASSRAPAADAVTPVANVGPSPLWSPPAAQPARREPGAPWGVFPNSILMPIPSDQHSAGMDPAVRRVSGGDPTPFIASLVPAPGSRGGYAMLTPAFPYRGKRVRFYAWLKSQDVQQRAGINLTIFGGPSGPINTPFSVPEVRGTTDWTLCQVVADVPNDAGVVTLTSYLQGPGKVWVDGFTLDVVAKTVPSTVDTAWHLWANWGNYDLLNDPGQARDGHATVLLRSASAPRNQWGALRIANRDLGAYRGKRVRISAMMRCAEMNVRGGLFANVTDATGRILASQGNRALVGTMGWLRYSIVIDVPPTAAMMESGVIMTGRGKIWVDAVTYEVVEKPATPSKLSTTARR
jgi:RNA polymerase sigma factor (sigma-70 family)